MNQTKGRIAVLGAGVTGVTAAYELMQRGLDVTLFDRNPHAAMETSFANGGQLSASNAEVWNSLSTVGKGLKWLFQAGAPLKMNFTPSYHKASWMTRFLTAIPTYESATESTARLAIVARDHLRRMAADEGIDFDCVARGILHFYADKKGYDHAAEVTHILAKAGLERRAITPDEIRDIEPALKGDFYGGFYTESDFTGDIHKFTKGLAEACARHGMTMALGQQVTRLKPTRAGVTLTTEEIDSGSVQTHAFDRVVISAGVGSRALAAMAGDRINVYPVKGYSITVNLHDEAARARAPWVSLLDDEAKIVTSRLGPDRYRVAGTAEFAGDNRDIRMARIDPLIAWVRKWHPGLSTQDVRPWAGLRPMMPDMLPRVHQGRHPHVFYNTGHGHLGWTLSAATANMLGDLVVRSVQTGA